jgi:hypothetical protein
MQHSKVHHDRVERAFLKVETFGVSLNEFQPWIPLGSERHHRWREINSNHGTLTACRGGCNVTRAAGNIEQAHPGTGANCIENRPHRLDGHVAESPLIRCGCFLPSGSFEIVKIAKTAHQVFLLPGDDSERD